MLRHYKPNRVVGIGSGYSSATMLDTRERFGWSQSRPTASRFTASRQAPTLYSLIEAVLCSIRHSTVHAEPRTMPNETSLWSR
jgi:hypothetical protein